MTKTYLITRTIVRTLFWGVVIGLGLLTAWAFYMAVWSLQYPY